MDETATAGSATSESTEKTSTESTGQGEVETHGSQGQTDNAGGSQDSSEGGKEQGTGTRRPFRSKNQTIYELRQKDREWAQKYQALEERISQFEQKFQPRQDLKPSRTFWEAPEEVLDERMTEKLSAMEQRLVEKWEQNQSRSQQTTEWKQETLEATKLIKNELKLSEDEEEELAEMLRSDPTTENMRPLQRAKYAKFLWNEAKGVTDKSVLKAKAASVHGAPPAAGGKRMWTEAEIEREVKKFPIDPRSWTPEQNKAYDALNTELKSAYAENRVRKQ